MKANTNPYQAYIFDLDGVLTQTAELHFSAWKALFDHFLWHRPKHPDEDHAPFQRDDYKAHVDGKPRHDGVREFLRARGITLPEGTPEDDPDQETIHGLGARKNALFQEYLQQRGAQTYSKAIDFLRAVKRRGARTAAVSSSKNAHAVMASVGILELFDARVDGRLGEQLQLAGKPAPDYFLEAAERLEVPPQSSVVLEDAVAGVEAGRRGDFGLVVGVAHESAPEALNEAGADVVVDDVGELDPDIMPRRDLPLALDSLDKIAGKLAQRRLGVFLDYDGTLTPIVSRPEDAVLSEPMRERVAELAEHCPVAIVSGRDLADVRGLVGLPQLYYVGSHGFDIAGSENDPLQHRPADDYLPVLDEAEQQLRQPLAAIAGAQLERKRYSIAIHYRNVGQEDLKRVEQAVNEVAAAHRDLRRGAGKKVIELRPRLDWHKGKAVHWLLAQLELAGEDAQTVYIGDDVTDEDVFRAIHGDGLGILVADQDRASLARYRLRDTDEVSQFLEKLSALIGGK